jgi:hypothetical protein
MNDMGYGLTYDVARERMAEYMREAEKARQVREVTRRKDAETQTQEFRPANARETLTWALGRWGRNALPTIR